MKTTAGVYSVAIFDAFEEHAASFVDALDAMEILATAFHVREKFLEFIGSQQVDLAILVLYSKTWWKDELRLLCNSIRYRQEHAGLEILCILKWPPKDAEEEAMDRISGDALGTDVLREW